MYECGHRQSFTYEYFVIFCVICVHITFTINQNQYVLYFSKSEQNNERCDSDYYKR